MKKKIEMLAGNKLNCLNDGLQYKGNIQLSLFDMLYEQDEANQKVINFSDQKFETNCIKIVSLNHDPSRNSEETEISELSTNSFDRSIVISFHDYKIQKTKNLLNFITAKFPAF
ncbi:hypothetical protein [Adhaeribacter soli]|uniref:Uncharacterized protein n=1 Tax=Adhaeribacter soli TaxID=2607655 RepID=A0A5N1J5V1_9BACT|nr:hypothetical protein [Adhaeribacter soli]KAA9345553.1 hypothetical protein F0P94_00230 [Adhaeribacter soli]